MRVLRNFLVPLTLSLASFSNAEFQYAGDYHRFSIPDSLHDVSIADITVPGSHNSFNRGGTGGGCASTNSLLSSNKNVHSSISEQIDIGVRLLELDVYKVNGRWCLFHGGGGNAFLDGNSYYFSDIISEIAAGLSRIDKEVLFLKIDGGQLDSATLLAELGKHGLQNSLYIRQRDEVKPPSLNELARRGKRLVIVGGGGDLGWGWTMASTSAKQEQRHGPFNQNYTHPNGVDAVKWNAFALDDTFGYGSTSDADYVHARLLTGAMEKWVQAGRRLTSIVVDFPRRESLNMTAMRAATILNQVPSIKGAVTTDSGETLHGVRYNYWAEDLNLKSDLRWYRFDSHRGKNIVTNAIGGTFDFPRPHGQGVMIRPFKEGYTFTPSSIYVEPKATANSIEVSFTAVKKSASPQDIAESHSFIYKNGVVDLAAGLDINAQGRVVVKDTTRQKGFAIINKGTGLCIGVAGGRAYQDAEVTMQNCDASPKQRWTYDPRNGRLKTVLGNYCLDTEGNGSSGFRQQLYPCINHNNLKYDIIGQRIVPAFTSANALDSNGRLPGAPLIVWNRTNDHANRFWIFEKHYAVSSNGYNNVTDASVDSKPQYFLLSNASRNSCLTADGTAARSKIRAKNCRVGDVNLKLWTYVNKQFKLKANQGTCLDNRGRLWHDSEPQTWNCIANHPNMSFRVNMPYWGGAARTVEPVAITPLQNANLFLDHPRDQLVRLANWENKVGNQGWVVVPVSID